MWKECNVVMLPTEKAENCILLHKKVTYAVHHPGKFFTQAYLRESDAISMHLYAISNEKPVVGDWIIEYQPRNSQGEVHRIDNEWTLAPDIQRKIIASTDSSLNLPIISREFIDLFIERYNANTPIIKVMVEYEEYMTEGWIPTYNNPDNNNLERSAELDIRPKLTDNAINIKSIKDSWTREEVEELLLILERYA